MSVGYDSYLVGLKVPTSPDYSYGEASSDDLSSEWDTDDQDPETPISARVIN